MRCENQRTIRWNDQGIWFKSIPWISTPFSGKQLKHFKAWDVISRWDTLEFYPSATAEHARQFLSTLMPRMPFPVCAIQVDGGSEFMQQFEQACAALGLHLFVIPPALLS